MELYYTFSITKKLFLIKTDHHPIFLLYLPFIYIRNRDEESFLENYNDWPVFIGFSNDTLWASGTWRQDI